MLADLSNSNLHERFVKLVGAENRVTAEVIQYIAEMDQRKSYLDYQCTSMYQYLTEVVKYSEGAACRRLSSARLLLQVPELKHDIASGELNLSQASEVAKGIRQKKKTGKVSAGLAKELLDLVKNKSGKETQVIVSQELDLPVQAQEKERVQKDESVVLNIVLSKEEYEELVRAQEIISHINPNAQKKDIVVYAIQHLLKKKDPLKQKSTAAAAALNPSKAQVRRDIFQRDQCCQWTDPLSGERCGSSFQLQVDHLVPKWAGGGDEASNLQLLCRVHNHLKYQMQAGLHRSDGPPLRNSLANP